jgi:hypothetical protein
VNRIVEVRPQCEPDIVLPRDWPPLTTRDWQRTRPERHWLLVDEQGGALARASVWSAHVPPLDGERLGLIGHFAAVDATRGATLLGHATRCLAEAGASRIVGPIDGSTWEPYRCVVESDGSPPFALEPAHPAHWPAAFAQAGFAPWIHYRSARCDDIARAIQCFDGLARRAAARSRACLRAIEPACWLRELPALHRLTRQAFAQSRLISTIDQARFEQRFGAMDSLITPGLVWLAELDAQPVGMVVALPGSGPVWGDCVIVKTLCALQRGPSSAIALLLLHRVFCAALARGLRRAVFALMDETNMSSRMVDERIDSRAFRRYALMARRAADQG